MTTTTTTTNISDKGVKLLVKNYVMLQNFSHWELPKDIKYAISRQCFLTLIRAVDHHPTPLPPTTPRLQMLRIDREEMIDDVKTHSA